MNRPISVANPFKICFVCLGNICRSPTAEGVFQHLVNSRELGRLFFIDSAGTSAWHIGEPANSKSQKTANRYGIKLGSRARMFEEEDLREFDLILAMDRDNLDELLKMDRSNQFREKIRLLRDFDPEPGNGSVPDPYYGGLDGFENVYNIVYRSCEQLLNELVEQIER